MQNDNAKILLNTTSYYQHEKKDRIKGFLLIFKEKDNTDLL